MHMINRLGFEWRIAKLPGGGWCACVLLSVLPVSDRPYLLSGQPSSLLDDGPRHHERALRCAPVAQDSFATPLTFLPA